MDSNTQQADISNVDCSSCNSIAPQGICGIVITGTSTITPDPEAIPFTIQGANTNAPTGSYVTTTATAISVAGPNGGDLYFSNPTTSQPPLNLTITNTGALGNNQATIAGIDATKLPPGVSIAAGNVFPVTLNVGQSITAPVSATRSAYGNGSVTVNYQSPPGATAQSMPINVQVAPLGVGSIVLEDATASNILTTALLGSGTSSTFTLVNQGVFNWQGATLSILPSGSLISIASNNCNNNVIPANGGTCSFTLTNAAGTAVGISATLVVGGTNVSPNTNNYGVIISGGVTAIPDSDLHLSYRAIKILNTSTTSYTLTTLPPPTISSLLPNVYYCASGDATCYYQTDCSLGSTLAPEESCRMWFKALPNTTSDPMSASVASGITINATATPNNGSSAQTLTKNFSATYDQSLYAAGFFSSTISSGNPATSGFGNIAKWNGTSWSPLGGGLKDYVYTLLPWRGDLYAGGKFSHSLSVWNGNAWTPVPGVTGVVKSATNYAVSDPNYNDGIVIGGVKGTNTPFVQGSRTGLQGGGNDWTNFPVASASDDGLGIAALTNIITTNGSSIILGAGEYSGGVVNFGGWANYGGGWWSWQTLWQSYLYLQDFMWWRDYCYHAVSYGDIYAFLIPTANTPSPIVYVGGSQGNTLYMYNNVEHCSNWYLIPVINGTTIYSLAYNYGNNNLYVGGVFSDKSGVGLLSGNAVGPFLPTALNGSAQVLQMFNNKLYIGGTFSGLQNIAVYNPNVSPTTLQTLDNKNTTGIGGISPVVDAITFAPSLTISD